MGDIAKWAETLPSLPVCGEASCVGNGPCVLVSDLLSNPYSAALLAMGLWANHRCLAGLVASSEGPRGVLWFS